MTINIGLAVVLIAAAFLIGLLTGRSEKKPQAHEQPETRRDTAGEAGGVFAPAPVFRAPDISDHGRFDAAVAAAIATYLGEDIKGLRIHAVRPLSQRAKPAQSEVAAISAAIATHMGTEASGLRIHSIRRVGAPLPDRRQMVAAISAAIATAMNTDVDGLRIRSIKKIS